MVNQNYDSEFCGKLPIHLTNQIQPYGALLVVDPARMRIIQGSENIASVFGRPVHELLDTELFDYLDATTVEELRERMAGAGTEQMPGTWKIGEREFLVLLHRKEGSLLVEIDLTPVASGGKEASFVEVYQELRLAMSSIESADNVNDICDQAVRELRKISGFDKVMLYRFDPQWNGTVVAEAGEPDMEPYVGLTFPASDIPQQARRLYLKNPYRYIPDRNYRPVSLFPVLNPLTNSFTDLSDCNLRSVAAVHLEYLGNMGVMASMSTRILHHDQLWGLIACHHRTPREINFKLCSIFELFSGIISMKITSLQNQERLATENALREQYSNLVEAVYREEDLDEALMKGERLLEMFSASGALLSRGGRYVTIGETPHSGQLEELILWLHTRQLKKVYTSSVLSAEYEMAGEYRHLASGLLVVPINYLKDQYLVLFRPEKLRVINWGGNPDERIRIESGGKEYHPRNSFRQWQQTVQGAAVPWNPQEVHFAELLRSFIYEYETSAV